MNVTDLMPISHQILYNCTEMLAQQQVYGMGYSLFMAIVGAFCMYVYCYLNYEIGWNKVEKDIEKIKKRLKKK
jgi:hypothetical protein